MRGEGIVCRLSYPLGGAGWEQDVALPAVPRQGDFLLIPEEALPGDGTQWAEDLRGEHFFVRHVTFQPVPSTRFPLAPIVVLAK